MFTALLTERQLSTDVLYLWVLGPIRCCIPFWKNSSLLVSLSLKILARWTKPLIFNIFI